jgi:chaperonin GroES
VGPWEVRFEAVAALTTSSGRAPSLFARGGRPRPIKVSTDGFGRRQQEECTLATATVSATKLRPLGDRVVIQPSAREEMTKSGIVLPDTAKEKPQEGTILSAGPGRINEDGKREPMDVKKGDKVLYAKYAGTEFKVEGEDLLIVSSKDILAIVED